MFQFRIVSALRLGAFLSAGLLFAGSLSAGIVNFVSQTRSVEVDGSGLTYLSSNQQSQTQQASAPDFSSFDKSVELNFSPIAAETASQSSSLTLTPDGLGARIDASGSLFVPTNLNGLNGSSSLDVSFTLSSSEPYTLTYNGRQGDARSADTQQFVPGSFDGPGAPGELTGDPNFLRYTTVLTYSGTLQAGSYELIAKSQTVGDAGFDVHLAIGTAAVPLPAALWQVLSAVPALLLCGGFFAHRLRRHHL